MRQTGIPSLRQEELGRRRSSNWVTPTKGASRGLIVQVHGGPTAHSEAALSAFIQSAVAAGFSVLDPNYRGSTGFGFAFREAIRKTGSGGLQPDHLLAGIQ